MSSESRAYTPPLSAAGRENSMRRALAALVTLSALGTGCSDARTLLDEGTAQPYASWVARGAAFERSVERIEAQRKGEPKLIVEVVSLRSKKAVDDRLLVLQPGILADHRTWRFLAPLLAERNDVLMIDPPGTGRSDAPDPERHPKPAWTPAWVGGHTLRAVDRWQQNHGDNRRVVFVGHSLGSFALLRALTDPALRVEQAALHARIDGLVLFTLPDVLMREVDPTLERIAGLSDLEVAAAMTLGLLDRETADAVYEGVVDPDRRALGREAGRLRSMLAEDRTRHAAQAMLRRWRPVDADGRPIQAEVQAIADRERTLALPVLLLWGAQDPTLPQAMATTVAARLQRVERFDIADAMHSAHQERADLAAWRIARFLGDHGLKERQLWDHRASNRRAPARASKGP